MPESISSVLEKLFEAKGVRDKIDAASVQSLWAETVGEIISENSSVVSFNRGIITVKAANPVWRNELMMQKTVIHKNLLKMQNRLKIKDIRFI